MKQTLRAFALAALAAAACGDDSGDDDVTPTPDGEPAVPDAFVPTADAAICTESLAPADDGSGQPSAIVISEIKPGEYIELFNGSDQDIDLGGGAFAAYQWCSPFEYFGLPNTVTVPAGGYALTEWPVNFTNATDEGGQIILYSEALFDDSTKMLDFVCWGTGNEGRITIAETAGKWSGGCADAIPEGGAISRIPETTGTTADDYTVIAPPSPTNCRAP